MGLHDCRVWDYTYGYIKAIHLAGVGFPETIRSVSQLQSLRTLSAAPVTRRLSAPWRPRGGGPWHELGPRSVQ